MVDPLVHMLKDGFSVKDHCFPVVIRVYSVPENVSIGDTLFAFIIKSSYLDSDLCDGCALIDMFAKGGGDSVSARKAFEKCSKGLWLLGF